MANSYLSRATSSTGNQKTFTVSAWCRQSMLVSNARHIFGSDVEDDGANYLHLSIEADGTIKVLSLQSSSISINLVTQAKFVDTTAFYHIVLRVDTTQSTEADRVRIYVNGSQVTAFGTSTYPSLNADTGVFASGIATLIGARHPSSSPNFFEGELGMVVISDGQSLAPSVFGETDSTSGIWKPILNPSFTAGTNGAMLKFENSANLGLDSKGSNNFTVNGNLKQSNSTATNKFPALNPAGTNRNKDGANFNTNAGHTGVFDTTSTRVAPIDMCFAGGKWYWEAKIQKADASATLGVYLTDSTSPKRIEQGNADLALVATSNGGNGAVSFLANSSSLIQKGNSTTSYGSGVSDGDIIMCAFDCATGKIWFGRNGTFFNSGNPATGSNDSGKTLTNTDRELYSFYIAGQSSSSTSRTIDINFGQGFFGTTAVSSSNADANGQGLFEYAVPSGYLAVCSKNIQSSGG
tara:strand:- start:1689 stop:3083 length:1395 start_codon:yes stop_codon:yes gene_type:complete